MFRARLHDEDAHTTSGRTTRDETDRERAQQRSRRATDASVATTVRQRPAVGEHRSTGDQVEDQIVGLVGAGEVLDAVVNDDIGTDRSHERQSVAAAHRGDVPARLASWTANVPEPPPAPLISTLLPARAPAVPCSAIAPACGSVDVDAQAGRADLCAKQTTQPPQTHVLTRRFARRNLGGGTTPRNRSHEGEGQVSGLRRDRRPPQDRPAPHDQGFRVSVGGATQTPSTRDPWQAWLVAA